MQDETAKDNRHTAAWSSHDLTRNNELAVSSATNLHVYRYQILNMFFFYFSWKKYYFLITNQHQSLDSIGSKTKLPNRPKTSVTTKKIWIENHQSQPTSVTFWIAGETNAVQHRLWLAHLFCSLTRCLAQHCYSVKYRSYLLFADT